LNKCGTNTLTPSPRLGCTNAQLVSALSSTDTGTHNIANALFALPPTILNAALGGQAAKILASALPGVGFGAIAGDPQCLLRCGLASGNKTSLG